MRKFIIIGISFAALFVVALTAFAQTSDSFDIPWFSVDGGGGTSAGGEFVLSGSIGQADAGTPLTGGNFAVTGGVMAGFGPTTVDGVCGDLNDDEAVNVFDAIIELQIIVGKIQPTEQQLALGNVVIDDAINVFDVILILRHIVGAQNITGCGPLLL